MILSNSYNNVTVHSLLVPARHAHPQVVSTRSIIQRSQNTGSLLLGLPFFADPDSHTLFSSRNEMTFAVYYTHSLLPMLRSYASLSFAQSYFDCYTADRGDCLFTCSAVAKEHARNPEVKFSSSPSRWNSLPPSCPPPICDDLHHETYKIGRPMTIQRPGYGVIPLLVTSYSSVHPWTPERDTI
jgi:hypothetical protein